MSKKFILIILTIFSLSTLPEYIHGAARSDNVFSLKGALYLSAMWGFMPLLSTLGRKNYYSRFGNTLSAEEYCYCKSIFDKYKLPETLLRKINNEQAAAAFDDMIGLGNNFFTEENYWTEYTLLHEYGHVCNRNVHVRNGIYFFIFNLLLFRTINRIEISNLKNFILYTFNLISMNFLILKILLTAEENQADKFALNRLNYNDPKDYERLIYFYNLKELLPFEGRFKFLLSMFKSPILKRFLWFVHSNYIFPPDAIKILQDKLRHKFG